MRHHIPVERRSLPIPPVPTDAWRRKLESYRDWLLQEEKISKSDESKRLKKPPQSSGVLIQDGSVEGSFRKLVID